MKILVLQLARFGDIFQTWPVINALKRMYPHAQVDVMVRESFAEAIELLPTVSRIWRYPVADLMSPLALEDQRFDESLRLLQFHLEGMVNEKYDRIINLSFSPLSSYLVNYLAGTHTDVRGYMRQSDGYLAIPDDASAYFYAQVGVGKSNRFHVTDIFAAIAQVDVIETDWRYHGTCDSEFLFKQPFVIAHPGASDVNKCWPLEKWREWFEKLQSLYSGQCIFVGSSSEREWIEQIVAGGPSDRYKNLAGQTSLAQLFVLLQKAELLIASDSMVMQMANLVGCKSLNLSFASVNFWETGPRVKGSRVLWAATPSGLSVAAVCDHIVAIKQGQEGVLPYIERDDSALGYCLHGYPATNFEWDLIKALYQGYELPVVTEELTRQGLGRLQQACHLALDQMQGHVGEIKRQGLIILDQVDEIFLVIEKMVPEIRPLLSWFQTERLRIRPGQPQEVFRATRQAFMNLDYIIASYIGRSSLHNVSRRAYADNALG